MELHERLRQYNRWRSGEEDWAPDDRGPDPKELGELIAAAADRLEVLERAAKNLVAVKGRHHTAQAFKKLCDAVEKVGAGGTVQNVKFGGNATEKGQK